VRSDARQWASLCGEVSPAVNAVELATIRTDERQSARDGADRVGRDAVCLAEVLANAIGNNQITRGSREMCGLVRRLCRFQPIAFSASGGLHGRRVPGGSWRTLGVLGGPFTRVDIPGQE